MKWYNATAVGRGVEYRVGTCKRNFVFLRKDRCSGLVHFEQDCAQRWLVLRKRLEIRVLLRHFKHVGETAAPLHRHFVVLERVVDVRARLCWVHVVEGLDIQVAVRRALRMANGPDNGCKRVSNRGDRPPDEETGGLLRHDLLLDLRREGKIRSIRFCIS